MAPVSQTSDRVCGDISRARFAKDLDERWPVFIHRHGTGKRVLSKPHFPRNKFSVLKHGILNKCFIRERFLLASKGRKASIQYEGLSLLPDDCGDSSNATSEAMD